MEGLGDESMGVVDLQLFEKLFFDAGEGSHMQQNTTPAEVVLVLPSPSQENTTPHKAQVCPPYPAITDPTLVHPLSPAPAFAQGWRVLVFGGNYCRRDHYASGRCCNRRPGVRQCRSRRPRRGGRRRPAPGRCAAEGQQRRRDGDRAQRPQRLRLRDRRDGRHWRRHPHPHQRSRLERAGPQRQGLPARRANEGHHQQALLPIV